MTDILDMLHNAAEQGHATWKAGYDEARTELARRIRLGTKDHADAHDYAVKALGVVKEFLK